jgi:hypothetical protein
VGEADSRQWLARIARLLEMKPKTMVTGHGEVSRDPVKDLALTRDYLALPAQRDGQGGRGLRALRGGVRADRLEPLREGAAFDAANRVNAYGTYLLMERREPRAMTYFFARELVVGFVQVRDDVLLVVGEELEVELRIAERHLRLELLDGRDLAVLAQVHGLRVPERLVVVAGLALAICNELPAFGGSPAPAAVPRRPSGSRGGYASGHGTAAAEEMVRCRTFPTYAPIPGT